MSGIIIGIVSSLRIGDTTRRIGESTLITGRRMMRSGFKSLATVFSVCCFGESLESSLESSASMTVKHKRRTTSENKTNKMKH